MMKYAWWVPNIDFRISSALILFFLLFLFGKGKRRKNWGLRMAVSLVVLCGVSWLIRYASDQVHASSVIMPLGYGLYIMVLSLLYLVCYRFCVKTTEVDYVYNSIVALIVYRIAWNVLKTIVVGLQASKAKIPWSLTSPFESLFSYAIYALVCWGCYLIYRKMVKGPCQLDKRILRFLFVVIVLLQMVLEFTFRLMNDGTRMMFLIYLTTLMFCLVTFALLMMFPYMDRLRQANASMQDFIRSKQEYYEISREGILSLQTKCHDLKHQIAKIRFADGQRQFNEYLNRLEDSIDEYNTVIDTGNQSLDVVLTEKNIICATKGIKFTYIVDGSLFNFLSDMDVYALFGNIMDNAIESTATVQDAEKRLISLKVARRNGMIVLFVENYFENELKYQDGHLITTKAEKHHHGLGLRSITSIAEKHGGMASFVAEDHLFKLTVTLKDKSA